MQHERPYNLEIKVDTTKKDIKKMETNLKQKRQCERLTVYKKTKRKKSLF